MLSRLIAHLIVLTGVVTFLSGCGADPRVVGTVTDPYGNPIEGVTVSIVGSTLSSITDKSGSYSLTYVPGKFTVSFKKNGFTTHLSTHEIVDKVHFPAQTAILYRVPSSPGIFLLDPKGGDPIQLEHGKMREDRSRIFSDATGGALVIRSLEADGRPTISTAQSLNKLVFVNTNVRFNPLLSFRENLYQVEPLIDYKAIPRPAGVPVLCDANECVANNVASIGYSGRWGQWEQIWQAHEVPLKLEFVGEEKVFSISTTLADLRADRSFSTYYFRSPLIEVLQRTGESRHYYFTILKER